MNIKKYLPLIILAGLLAVLLLVYGIMTSRETPSYPDEDTKISVISRDVKTITDLTYTYSGETHSFVYDGGVWSYKNDSNFPVNQTLVSSMAAKICAITAYRQIDTAPSAEYGLDDPIVTVSVTYSDGKTFEYAMSDENSYNRYIYLWNKADDFIYTVLPSSMTVFKYKEADLIVKDAVLADLDREYINNFYLKSVEGEEVTMTDIGGINGIYAFFVKLDFALCADYYADSTEKLDKYGLDENGSRIYVSYGKLMNTAEGSSGLRVDADYTIVFGNTVTEEDSEGNEVTKIYYSPKGSNLVYLADYELYSDIMYYIDFEPVP